MAKIISLDAFRARSVPKFSATPQLQSAEHQASALMAAAADLLLESSPSNLRVAWMLQDLRDLLATSHTEDEVAALPHDREVLTNLG